MSAILIRVSHRKCGHNGGLSRHFEFWRHQFARLQAGPLAVALHLGLDGQLGLQGGNGVAGLVLLPEPDHRIGYQEREDDEEIRPMPVDGRKNYRRFDHPGNRSPEVAEKFQEGAGLLYLNFVRPVLEQPLLRLGPAETVGRRRQSLLQLRNRQGFQIALPKGLQSRLRFRGV